MSAPRGSKPMRGQGRANSSTYLVVQEGPVMLAYGASSLLLSGFQESISGSWGGKPGYRKVKVRPERPDSTYTLGTAVTDTTPFAESLSLSALGSFMFVQPLFAGAASSGVAEAFVNWQAFVQSTGQLVARETFQLEPDINATKTGIFPIGQPFPAHGLNGVMVAAVVSGVSGTITFNLVSRTFTADPRRPSAWSSNLLGSDQTYTGNDEFNSGDLSFMPTGAAFAQVGLKLPSADAYGTLDVLVAARY